MAQSGIGKQPATRAREGQGLSSARLTRALKTTAGELTGQGLTKLSEVADERKNAIADKLDDIAEVVRHFSDRADESLRPLTGGAVGQGGDALARMANTIRQREVGELVEDTRSIISRHPVLAISAASIVGLVVGRIVKGGISEAINSNAPRADNRRGLAA